MFYNKKIKRISIVLATHTHDQPHTDHIRTIIGTFTLDGKKEAELN